MDVDRLVEASYEQAGSTDFGGDSYREGLERFADALDREADLTEVGTLAMEAQITGNLVNRLRVTDWISSHPEVLEQRVEAPLFVLGLPRTGTTLMSYLLGCDPARRSLMRWEAASSIPPPEAATFTTDPRIEEARVAEQMMDALNPGFKAIHYEAPDGPTECVTLLAQDFKSLQLSIVAYVPSYDEWLLACDQSPAYVYHQRALQVLQSRAPGAWTLKSPHHSIALDPLFGQYPDAKVVVLHRDPVRVVGSVCSLARSLSGTFSDVDRRDAIASHWTDIAQTIVDRVSDYRDRNGDGAFFDVQYADLVTDPLGTVRKIYVWSGTDLTPEAESRMSAYVDANPQTKHGSHSYSLDGTGLDRAEIEARFAKYRERYAVPHEG